MKTLPLELIRTDGGTQMRAELNKDTYLEYRDVWKTSPDSFPPLVVFHDGSVYWLADGFHRFYGAREAGRASVPVEVKNGTVRDAILYAVGANQANGLRRNNADKRNAVTTLLSDEEWVAWSDSAIAEQAGVSHPFVADVRRQLVTVTSSPAAAQADKPRTGKDGKKRKPPKKKPGKVRSQSDEPGNGSPSAPPKPPVNPDSEPGETELSTQRSKTVKTVEALMRAFDDLNTILSKKSHGWAIDRCKELLLAAREWK